MVETEQNIKLTCEYLYKPIGIQNIKPRFGWSIVSGECNLVQEKYQIQVYDFMQRCVWDSGKVKSDKCSAVEYNGLPLESFQEYRWKVTLWLEDQLNKDKKITRHSESVFEMGILKQEEWRGEWIGAKDIPNNSVPLIRKEFKVDTIPERARVYLSGIGYCEAWINGQRLGDSFLDPGWTNYTKTVLYRTYDITKYIHTGKNVFSAELGGGWLTLDHPAFKKMIGRKTSWLSETKLLCNIYLDCNCIASTDDGTWMYSEGPVCNNNIYDGEYYDASKEKEGYRLPGYRDIKSEWKKAEKSSEPGGMLRSQIMPPIRNVYWHEPQYIEYVGEDNDYTMTVDFGINFSGWVQLKAKGEPGQKIRILYGETLNQNHSLNQKNLREAKAEDTFVFGDNEDIVYHPHFTYHGFRYAQIEMDQGVIIEDVKGCEIHTDVRKTGAFSCSNPVLNRIQKAMQRTEINNLHSVPTDCPQRDERLGWMNDMTVRYEEALYNFDMILFYEKWLQDIEDAQGEDGAIPDTVPYFFGNFPACHISSVYILLPWNLYLFYNDTQILKRHYCSMKKYLEFKINERQKNGILPEKYFGDWAPPMTEAFLGWGENAVPKNLTQGFITTCYLYYDCITMEKIARTLDYNTDADIYKNMACEIKSDLNRCFYHKEGYYDTGAQGCNAFPLFLDIVPSEDRNQVRKSLIDDLVGKHNYRITTGNQMTKYLYEVLNKEKMDDIAYALSSSEEYPSIGYMIKNGATTIWERWENLTNNHMNSHNHPMLGAYTVWFYKGLAGIQVSESQSRRLILQPAIIDELDYVKASHEFSCGLCQVQWEKKNEMVVYSFEIPWNMTAMVDLSNCAIPYNRIKCDNSEITFDDLIKCVFSSGSHKIELMA